MLKLKTHDFCAVFLACGKEPENEIYYSKSAYSISHKLPRSADAIETSSLTWFPNSHMGPHMRKRYNVHRGFEHSYE